MSEDGNRIMFGGNEKEEKHHFRKR